jgi:4,5-dihydroxyphthalate decarboxylase
MSRLPITLAISGYHHTAPLTTGVVPVVGVDLRVLTLSVEEIFYRFIRYREWEVSEMSFAKYIALRSQGDDSLVALPVFPSRVFRHSSIFVPKDGVTTPEDLRGARVGVPEWAQTAAVYSRGLLVHDYGVGLDEISWFQAGVNEPGRVEKVTLALPDGVSVTPTPDRSLNEMLLCGDLDAVLSAHPPHSIEENDPRVRRLFKDYVGVERDYAARTGIFPIMHVIVIRGDVHRDHPWLARNLMTAFEHARALALAELTEMTASRVAVPWLAQLLEDQREALFGDGPYWPYGVADNHRTLDAFAQYAFEQGVAQRRLTPEELFPPELQSGFRV